MFIKLRRLQYDVKYIQDMFSHNIIINDLCSKFINEFVAFFINHSSGENLSHIY